jgi:hypothetical protein
MLLAAVVIACSDDDPSTARQCSLVDGTDIEEVTQLSVSNGVPFEHEASGDGTWCLYEVDGKRIELQFQPGDPTTFEARRQQADREGAEFAPFDDIGEAAFFGTAGINSTTVLVDGHLLVVQSLDVISDDAKALTSAVARIAAARCCPP